ncbi:hypothetical protein FHS27_002397 [Rhodopirellula rubra]|uniref:Uncharacterized protein n=1 Tax=Aporhodopirellula rubra TaxID=980271 RepID=A0A7W5DY48_9BACT|nr:hypothetical protein [Aporhodopirellula rubra]
MHRVFGPSSFGGGSEDSSDGCHLQIYVTSNSDTSSKHGHSHEAAVMPKSPQRENLSFAANLAREQCINEHRRGFGALI